MSTISRMATIADIDALVRVRFDYFAAESWALDDAGRAAMEAQFRSYYTRRLGEDFFAAFLEEDGVIASVAFLAISEKPANHFFPTGKVGTVLNVLTYPEYRRKGYALRAMEMLIDQGRRIDLSYIDLSASEMGLPLYKKLGFEVQDLSKVGGYSMKLTLI